MHKRTETAKRVNRYEPDPITNRVMSDKCWDSEHHPKCAGWLEWCDQCRDEDNWKRHAKDCNCECHCRCDCECHKDYPRHVKVKRDPNLTKHIIDDTDYGTIEVK